MLIDVVIPTVDRKEGLKRAVLGVLKQEVSFASVKIVIIDNSRDAQQRQLVSELTATADSPMKIHYVHEPRSGLAFARNRGISESQGEYIVFLDDDEAPVQNSWLSSMVGAAVQSNADAAFGPITAIADPGTAPLPEFVAQLHSRDLKKPPQADVTDQLASLGTGNACFRRSSCFADESDLFSHEFNHTGGEDVEFLRRLRSNNRRFAWASEALAYEFLPPSRVTTDYLSYRRFQQGQQRVYLQISTPPRRYDAMVFLMAVGLAQASYHFLARGIARLTGSRDAWQRHDIQIRGGLGKVLWQRKYRRKYYGNRTGT